MGSIPKGHGQSEMMVKVRAPGWAPEATAAVSLLSPNSFPFSPSSLELVSLFSECLVSGCLLPLSVRSENNCFLYGVFNGYDGNRVTNFVAQRLSAELLLGQLNAEHTEADVRRVLLQVLALGRQTQPPVGHVPRTGPAPVKCGVSQGCFEDPAPGASPRGRGAPLPEVQEQAVSSDPSPQLAWLRRR